MRHEQGLTEPGGTNESSHPSWRLWRRFDLRVSKKEPLGGSFDRVVASLADEGVDAPEILFHLEDRPDAKVSGCRRILKNYPGLTPFSYEAPYPSQVTEFMRLMGMGNPIPVLSNLGEEWDDSLPDGRTGNVDHRVLSEILAKFPRSYPLGYVNLIFDRIGWPDVPAKPERARRPKRSEGILIALGFPPYLSPSILLLAGAHRPAFLATMPWETPASDQATLHAPSDRLRRLLDRLGTIHSDWWIIMPDDRERLKLAGLQSQAKAIVDRYREDWADHLRSIPLPFDLPAPQFVPQPTLPGTVACKAALVAEFRPRGYRYVAYESGHGGYRLDKRTAKKNLLQLRFDNGSWNQSYSAHLGISGPLWCAGFPVGVTAHAERGSGASYPILDAEHWGRIVANCAVVVDHLETSVVREIEDMFGPTPDWFSDPQVQNVLHYPMEYMIL